MRKLILAGALAFFMPSLALADGLGYLQANPRNSGDASSTIGSTGIYQTVFSANVNRVGCDIQNQGTHNMNVRVNGTTVFILQPYTLFYCNNSFYTIVSLIEITGTTGDAFAASSE